MTHLMATVHEPAIAEFGFQRVRSPAGFGEPWVSFQLPSSLGEGYYHLCSPTGEWSIAIHDFSLARDSLLEFSLPEYLSITWYESICGEECDPPRVLRPGHVTGYYSRPQGWRARIRGDVPIRSVGIEVTPDFSRHYLDAEYGGRFGSVREAFESLHVPGGSMPELRSLLLRLWPDDNSPARSTLSYEGAVLQAMGILVERTRLHQADRRPTVNPDDRERIVSVMAHIDEHYDQALPLTELTRLACMGSTKFKESFRDVAGMSVTRYLQSRRIGRAEQLLRRGDLTVAQVAHIVGYSSPGRFSEIFRRQTGMLPSEYLAIHR